MNDVTITYANCTFDVIDTTNNNNKQYGFKPIGYSRNIRLTPNLVTIFDINNNKHAIDYNLLSSAMKATYTDADAFFAFVKTSVETCNAV